MRHGRALTISLAGAAAAAVLLSACTAALPFIHVIVTTS
jgi:hypothetical protein